MTPEDRALLEARFMIALGCSAGWVSQRSPAPQTLYGHSEFLSRRAVKGGNARIAERIVEGAGGETGRRSAALARRQTAQV